VSCAGGEESSIRRPKTGACRWRGERRPRRSRQPRSRRCSPRTPPGRRPGESRSISRAVSRVARLRGDS